MIDDRAAYHLLDQLTGCFERLSRSVLGSGLFCQAKITRMSRVSIFTATTVMLRHPTRGGVRLAGREPRESGGGSDCQPPPSGPVLTQRSSLVRNFRR